MKNIVEYLQQKNIIFKSLKPIFPKELGTRKKIEIYLGINLKGYYGLVMCLSKKSRVLRKETEEIIVLHQKIQNYIDAMIPYCYILIDAPLCSKAKTMLNEHGWKVFHREIGSRE